MKAGFYSLYARARRLWFRVWYIGKHITCPLCGHSFRKMLSGGSTLQQAFHKDVVPCGFREGVYCPSCRSTDKERLMYEVFKEEGLFSVEGKPASVLHFAPEKNLLPHLQSNTRLHYVTGDIVPGRAMQVVDITHIDFPDKTFDFVICSHVLEHIPDDAQAMRELYRVLTVGGVAHVQVPLLEKGDTFEDPSVTSFGEREKVFGQGDHVRIYGKDFKERLERAGFVVTWQSAVERFGKEKVAHMGVNPRETIVIALK